MTYDAFRSYWSSNGRNYTLTSCAGPFVIVPLISWISMLPARLGAGATADLQLGVIAEKQVIVREFFFKTKIASPK